MALRGSPAVDGFRQVGFSAARFGWAVDDGYPSTLYLTDDGGRHWRRGTRPR